MPPSALLRPRGRCNTETWLAVVRPRRPRFRPIYARFGRRRSRTLDDALCSSSLVSTMNGKRDGRMSNADDSKGRPGRSSAPKGTEVPATGGSRRGTAGRGVRRRKCPLPCAELLEPLVEFVAVLRTHTDRVGRSLRFDSGGGAVAASEAFVRLSVAFRHFDLRARSEHGVDATSQLILGDGPLIRVPIGGDGEDASAATANSLLRRSLAWPGVLQADGTTRFPCAGELRYKGGESIPIVELDQFERVIGILRLHLAAGHRSVPAKAGAAGSTVKAGEGDRDPSRSRHSVAGTSSDPAGRGRRVRRARTIAPQGWIWQQDACERYGVPQSTLNSWNDRGFFSSTTRVHDADHSMIRFQLDQLEHVLRQHRRLDPPASAIDR